jgi:DNA-binding NarL/FixJ family response regulator
VAPALSDADPIRVAIVDDHPMVREGTAALLGAQDRIAVVATAGSVEEARAMLASTAIDVVLLDIRLGTDSGLRLLGGDGPAIVVVTAYDYPQYVEAALRLGAAGFVLKTAPVAELLDAIRRAAAGGLAFATRPRGGPAVARSAREPDGVRRGVDEIGSALGIGGKTVESHLRRLFERLGVASRTELATRALREGWLDLPPS